MIQYKVLMFQKESTLINQMSQKSVSFLITGFLKTLVMNVSNMFVMDAMIYH